MLFQWVFWLMRSLTDLTRALNGAGLLLSGLLLAGCVSLAPSQTAAPVPAASSPAARRTAEVPAKVVARPDAAAPAAPKVAAVPPRRTAVPDFPIKIGKPYQVQGVWYSPSDDRGYDEVGYASWYGDAFHGAPTANGERFDMDMVGAAHKTLPLPSYVEVTALESGRTLLVRVNDRGPFVTNRIIDLSRRSAQLLGIDRKGVARVRVRRVEPPEADRLALRSGVAARPRPDAPALELAQLDQRFQAKFTAWSSASAAVSTSVSKPPAPKAAPVQLATRAPLALDAWFVQIGAFGDQGHAQALAARTGAGLQGDGNFYRVRLGPYFDEQSAQAALARMQGQGYQDARLIRPSADF